MVSFSSIRYSMVVRRWKRQNKVYQAMTGAAVGVAVVGTLLLCRRAYLNRQWLQQSYSDRLHALKTRLVNRE